jgi:DNA-directed RNA polymerase III subunit RPC1
MGKGSKSGLFYSLIRDNSSDIAAACMLRIAKFSARWISTLGLSIGINDVTPFESLTTSKQEILRIGYDECNQIIEKFKNNSLELKAGCNAEQTLESDV